MASNDDATGKPEAKMNSRRPRKTPTAGTGAEKAAKPAKTTVKARAKAADSGAKPKAKSAPKTPSRARVATSAASGADAAASARADASAKPAPEPTEKTREKAEGAALHHPSFADVLQRASVTETMAANIDRIDSLGQRLLAAISQRKPVNPGVEGPGNEFYLSATQAMMRLWAEQPARVLERQVSFWGETLKHFADAQSALAKGKLKAPQDSDSGDRRFANPLWQTHPFFNFIKKQYQINARNLERATADLEFANATDRRRADWFTRQMIDMLSPTNFLATNPDALERALETEGESLVKGLENLVRDLEHHGGNLVVTLADPTAFRVGENIGTADGAVVAREPLYELIQYTPTTTQVHATPLIIFPPWINKFYIMDLKPQNSLIRWIVDQGYTLFVVSWKNPDASYANTGLEDYVASYFKAMDTVLQRTNQKKLNVIGYCIAGTTLALTLALMKKRGDERVNSATFFTTLTDFSDQGEFTTFLQDDFVSGIETEIEQTGYLGGSLMARTFSFLRANDLVWQPAIRSYMLGEAPPAFDLLYWNGDSTNLPGKMTMDYLRGLCQQNAFATEAGFPVLGQRVTLSDVDLPICAIAAESDHIAPAKDSWNGIARMGSKDKTFILSQSGHIAGIINPPSKVKYGHYTSDAGFGGTFDDWRNAATFHEGSWWPRWEAWLTPRSGPMVPARDISDPLEAAPGSYVHEVPAA